MNGLNNMQLHYEYHQNAQTTHIPIVFIHGLFGSLSNLGVLARALQVDYSTIQLDLRNHGLSGHDDELNYDLLAQDVIETLNNLNIEKFILIGHSMGGKTAMRVADLAANRVEKLVVLDISPCASADYHHTEIFQALQAVEQADIQTRQDATHMMQKFIVEPMVIQFLLKSFSQGKWHFNVESLFKNYREILSWNTQKPWTKPVLFLRGEKSTYISKDEHFSAIQKQFPYATIHVIKNAGHWLHGENPKDVLAQIQTYLLTA